MALKVSNDLKLEVANLMWPIGSIYTTISTADPKTMFGGTWVKIGADRCLMTANTDSLLNTTAESGLPNITGTIVAGWGDSSGNGLILNTSTGAFGHQKNAYANASYWRSNDNHNHPASNTINIDASRSSAVYGRASIVRPPVYYVYHWRRTA